MINYFTKTKKLSTRRKQIYRVKKEHSYISGNEGCIDCIDDCSELDVLMKFCKTIQSLCIQNATNRQP